MHSKCSHESLVLSLLHFNFYLALTYLDYISIKALFSIPFFYNNKNMDSTDIDKIIKIRK